MPQLPFLVWPLLRHEGQLAIQFADQFQTGLEEAFAERFAQRAVGRLRVLAEELQVLAVVEDIEKLLVLARREQVRTKPRASSEHLPELRLGPHQFEENEVHHFRHINARV